MKSVSVLLSLVIVVLGVSLFHQVRARRNAEQLLKAATPHPMKAASVATGAASSRDSLAALDSLVDENRRLREKAERNISGSVSASTAKLAALRDLLVRLPEQSIPELQFATDGDWYSAVDGPLESTEDYRLALGKLRAAAEKRFAGMAQPALQAYLEANRDEFPKDVSELQPYFKGPIDPFVLRRYKIVPASEVKSVGVGGPWAITQRSLIDSSYDSHSVIGPRGYGAFSKR